MSSSSRVSGKKTYMNQLTDRQNMHALTRFNLCTLCVFEFFKIQIAMCNMLHPLFHDITQRFDSALRAISRYKKDGCHDIAYVTEFLRGGSWLWIVLFHVYFRLKFEVCLDNFQGCKVSCSFFLWFICQSLSNTTHWIFQAEKYNNAQ